MSTRTCLLCSKPINRFLGGSGDFCSREHRNQYQMRQGMDRLNEVNKVASLMRRRENTKAISAAHLMSDYTVAPRDFGLVRIPPSLPSLDFKPTPAGLPTPRVPSSSNASRWRFAIRPAGGGQPAAAHLSIAGASSARHAIMPPPQRAHRSPVAMPPAHIAPLRNRSSAPAPRRREFDLLRHPAGRVHFGSELRTGTGQACEMGQQARGMRLLRNAAAQGRALRISAGIGFRVHPAIRPSFASAGPGPVVAPVLDRSSRVAPQALSAAADLRAAEIQMPPSEPAYRAPQIRNGAVSLHRGSPFLLACAARSVIAAARTSEAPWIAPPPLLPRPESNGGSNGVVRPGTTRVFRTGPSAVALNGTQRSTLVPFAPEEVPFNYSTGDVHGTFGSGAPAPPPPLVKQNAAPEARIEEHFNNGFTQWTGGVDTWKLDAAGVRVGKLALFVPSLEWTDYDFEFLARIENRSVTWVFRAFGLDEYYQASLAKTATGYEFSRCTILGGQAEPAVTVTVPWNGPGGAPPKTTITVRTRVRGEQFTVSVDNQNIETWSDIRLPIGGIGFTATPDNRARLYWVTISPAGSINKEQWKQ